jgi:glutamyl-Q tRNA(Asp) synthetase
MTDDASSEHSYRGRFAPSPTGPLHFGSLVAAVASYLQALTNQGEWLVRVEDIDPPREIPGATDSILRSLDAHGFEFAPPVYQSRQLATYDVLIDSLLQADAAYLCSCSRQEIRATAREGIAGPVYAGTCRKGANTDVRPAVAVRVRTNNDVLSFDDALQGTQRCRLESEIGDFLIRRSDGLVAYQLAVVADDAAQRITEVVRGTDLLEATFMQLWLQRLLGYTSLNYMHFLVALGPDGQKLSKQTGATGVNDGHAAENLCRALDFLGQKPEIGLKTAPLKDLWAWATANWDPFVLQGAQNGRDGSMMTQ